MDKRTYTITYKDGRKETYTGSIVFFTDNTGGMLPNTKDLIYLNSDSVRSVIEVETEGEKTDESHE